MSRFRHAHRENLNGQKASSKARVVVTDNALSAYFLTQGVTSNWQRRGSGRKAERI